MPMYQVGLNPINRPDYDPSKFRGVKRWSNDKEGDRFWADNPYGNEGWFPVWNTESEIASQPIEQMSKDLSDPDSKYYTDYFNKLKGTLSKGSSVSSLLGFNKGMGLGTESAATIANEQNKAYQAKATDAAITGTSDLFLANTSNALNASSAVLQNSQFNQNMNFQKDMYKKQKEDAMLNSLLGLFGGIGLNYLGAGGSGGNTKMGSYNPNINYLDMGSSWMDKQYGRG